MAKAFVIIGILSLVVAFNANAHDSNRIGQLEREIQEITLRLSKLESLFGNQSNAQRHVASGEGWKSVVNWRQLNIDMSASEVRKTLGEPYRVNGGRLTTWYYENGGTVIFYEGNVEQWMEPVD